MRTITKVQHQAMFKDKTYYLQYEQKDPDKKEFLDDFVHGGCVQIQVIKAKDWKTAREHLRSEPSLDWI